VAAVAASVAAGGAPIPQPNPDWAPWPAHSWPASNVRPPRARNNHAHAQTARTPPPPACPLTLLRLCARLCRTQTPSAQTLDQIADDVANTDGSAEDVLQQMQQAGCPMSCAQMEQLITSVRTHACCVCARAATLHQHSAVAESYLRRLHLQLQAQGSTVHTAAATLAAGGSPVPANNPNWAPWPAHAWPESQTPNAQLLGQTVNQVQSTDSTEIDSLWQEMSTAGC
jgi:hypothetical protein